MCNPHMESWVKMADSSKVMSKKADQAKTIETFQRLRAEQRAIASKMSELDAEKTEHKYVSN